MQSHKQSLKRSQIASVGTKYVEILDFASSKVRFKCIRIIPIGLRTTAVVRDMTYCTELIQYDCVHNLPVHGSCYYHDGLLLRQRQQRIHQSHTIYTHAYTQYT